MNESVTRYTYNTHSSKVYQVSFIDERNIRAHLTSIEEGIKVKFIIIFQKNVPARVSF